MGNSSLVAHPVSSAEEMDILLDRMKADGWATMNPVHRAFAHSYLDSYDHRGAAKEVGHAAAHGIKLLRDPIVAAYIAEMQNQSRLSTIISKDFINMNYLKLLDYAMGREEMPIVLASGDQITAKKVMVGEAKNILAEMAKSTEYEKDTGTKTAAVSISINMGSLLGDDAAGVVIDGDIVE